MPYFSLILLCILSYLKILREHIKTNVKLKKSKKNKNSSCVDKLNILI